MEKRPTEEAGGLKNWPYCPKCWSRMTELRKLDLNLALLDRAV
jgi:hypothetical protein